MGEKKNEIAQHKNGEGSMYSRRKADDDSLCGMLCKKAKLKAADTRCLM